MKNKIYYCYGLGQGDQTPDVYNILPEDFFSGELTKSHVELKAEHDHSKCPSVKEWHKNNFIVKAPFDIEFIFDQDKKDINLLSHPNNFNFKNALFAIHESFRKDPSTVEIQMAFFYTFWTDPKKKIWLETHHHPDLGNNNLELIPGKFPFSVWSRPVQFSFKIKDLNKTVKIKKDDPLYYIRFYSKDSSNDFEFIKKIPDLNIIKKMKADARIKLFAPLASWQLIKQRLTKKNSCPISIWKG